jgi:triosephosphate isomerase
MQAVLKRVLFVGGNWKSNGTLAFIKEMATNMLNKLEYDQKKLEICVSPTYIHLATAKAYINPNIIISSQNVSQFVDGAYTGEITARQLKDFGVSWTIIGHSERRNYYKETDDVISTKVKLAQDEGLNIILCIGENLEEREANKTWEICEKQLVAVKGTQIT